VASCGTPLALQRFKGDKRLEGCIAVPAFRYSRAFSSEVGTGSREENAKKKERSIFDGDRQRSDPGFRQCPVSGEPPNRPVPAAAIVGLRDVIAIANLRDLPEAAIAPFESK